MSAESASAESSSSSSTLPHFSLVSVLQHSSKFSTRSGTSSSSSASFPAPKAPSTPSAEGTLDASFFRCVKDSAPNWLRIPGNKSVICLFAMSSHRKSVSGQRGLHLGVVKVDHCAVVFDHVDFF